MAETIRIEIPIETIDETEPGLSNVLKKMAKLGEAAKQSGNSIQSAEKKVTKFDAASERTQKTLSKWLKEKYELFLEAKDKISPVLSKLKNGWKTLGGKTWHITMKAIDFATSPIKGILNLLKNPIFQVGAVLGVSVGLKDTIDTYKNFEAAMSQVQAISGACGTQLEKLTEKAKEMGATTKFTATEAGEAFNYMAMAGWDTQQMLDGIEGILNLAAASGEDLGTTSDIVTDALTAFGLKASDATHFSDVLAKAASSANTNVSMMGETFKYAGAMAGTLGYSIEDVGVMIGLMANSGIKASQAGTELNSLFTRLSTNTNGARDAIEKLGIRFYNSSGKARPLAEVMNELRAVTADYNDEQKTNLANTIAGQRAQAGLLAILNTSTEDYNKLTEAISHADGAAAEMAGTMLNNLSGSITLLQSALDGVKISVGEHLAPYIREITNWLTDAMPGIEVALDTFMRNVDKKIDKMKQKFQRISVSKEWQNATFFEKIQIVWDEFIVEPFSTWWNSTGKGKLASIASDIGNGIGSGLKMGILTLLGIDLSDATSEAANIGAQFAKGFSEGFDFDFIQSKLGEGIKNLFSNALKLLPGGEAAGLSSVFSALLIHKIVSPLLGVGRGTISVGKSLFGKGEFSSSLVRSLIGNYSLAGEVAGTGMAEGSGLLGLLGKAGMFFGSGAATSTGLVAAGATGVAGTVAGGASIVSGLFDAYRATQAKDTAEKTAYGSSAGLKFGGAAIGAMLGSMILPGLGTAIGTGIGGTLGSFVGKVVKKDYQKKVEKEQKEVEELQRQAEKAQFILETTGIAVEDVTFKNEELTKVMNDSEASAEQFIKMFQEECRIVAKGAFGDVTLSLEEVKKVASEITFANMATELEHFAQTSSKTEVAWNNWKSAVSSIKKENWRASLGLKLSDIDKRNYRSEIDSFVKSAQTYVEDKHYEATVALQLLTNEEVDTSGLDDFYGSLKGKIETANEELQRVMSEALSDGVISTEDMISVKIGGVEYEMDEASALTALQEQIKDITDKLAEAQTEAQFQTLQIKYNGAALDVDSFDAMQKELQKDVSEAATQYEEALTITLTNLKLEVIDGAITKEEYDKAVEEATEGYYARINELHARVSTFNLESIATAWGSELSKIMPEIEGSTTEKLTQALNHAMLVHPDVATWTEPDVIRWLGLDQLNFDGTEQTMIAAELIQTVLAVPKGAKETLIQSYKDTVPTKEELMAAIDFTQFSGEDWEALIYSINPLEIEEIFPEVTDKIQPLVEKDAKDFEALCGFYAERLHQALEKSLDSDMLSDFKEEYMGDFLEVQGPMKGEDYETLLKEYRTAGENWGDALNTGVTDQLLTGSSLIRTAAENSITNAFANPFHVAAIINMTGNYRLLNQGIPQIPQNEMIEHHATGGYVNGKQLSWIGEEGPEAIIPLIPSRRERALELYKQVGEIIGVGAHADGGLVGGNHSSFFPQDKNNSYFMNHIMRMEQQDVSAYFAPENQNETSTEEGTTIQVSVQMSPEFYVSISGGQKEDDIIQTIRRHMREMADEIGGEIAGKLEEVFSNLPLKEA